MRLKCIKDYKSIDDWGFNKKLKRGIKIGGYYQVKRGIKIGGYYQVTNEDSLGYRVIDELGRNYWYIKECFEPIEETRDKLINELLSTQ